MEIGGNAICSKLGRRVVGLFIGSALIPLACLSFLTVQKVSTKLEKETWTSTRRSSKSTGMAILERLHLLEIDLRFAARPHGRSSGEQDPAAKDTHKVLLQHFRGILTTEGSRTTTLSGNGELRPPQLTEAELAHMETGAVAVISSRNPAGGIDVVMAMLINPADRSKGTVFGWPTPHYLWAGDFPTTRTGEVLVCDHNQLVLFSSTDPKPVLGRLQVSQKRLGSTGNFDWKGEAGADYMAGFWLLFMGPQYHSNWMLVTSNPRNVVMAPVASFRQTFLLITILTLLFVVILSLTQINRILKPITALKAAAQQVSGNDLGVRVGCVSNDEFADLGNSFNDMLDRLQANERHRDKIQAALEDARDFALSAANRETEILTNVSHELRTPVASIMSFAEIINTFGVTPEDTEEFTGIILTETERISRLLDSMLTLSGLQFGESNSIQEPLDLCQNVEMACRTLNATAEKKHIEVIVRSPEHAVTVIADSDQLTQVWTNLVGNALKFSPDSSKVLVTIRESESHCSVEVRDFGPGIPEEDHALIFERFRQSTNNMTDKPSGTGLGLTITQDIILQHQGSIELKSVPGEGATFCVSLPCPTSSHETLASPQNQCSSTDP